MFPTPATFRGPSPLQRACADGLFFCNAVSRMCREGDAAAEPLDRTAARSLFAACADSTLYPQSSPPEPVAGTVTIVVGARGVRPSTELRTARGWRACSSTLCPPCSPPRPPPTPPAAPPLHRWARPPLATATAPAAAPSRPASLVAALRARADALLGGPPPANHAACRRAFKLSDGGRAALPAPLRPGLRAPLPRRASRRRRATTGRAPGATAVDGEAGGWTGVAGADLRACRQLCDGCARCKYVATAPSRGECAWHARCSSTRCTLLVTAPSTSR